MVLLVPSPKFFVHCTKGRKQGLNDMKNIFTTFVISYILHDAVD